MSDNPAGWCLGGSHPNDYEVGVDRDKAYSGGASGFIKCTTPNPAGFGALHQVCKADKFLGQRLRMSAFLAAKFVQNWTGLLLRVDGIAGNLLSFDNMQDRPLRGSFDWESFDVVLDVPHDGHRMTFGLLLVGPGQVWVDSFAFEQVGSEVPTTGRGKRRAELNLPDGPVNLGFEDSQM